MKLLDKLKINHKPRSGGLDLLKYIGPGLLVTVGFIDPGNWATNLAAGSEFGYALLWVVTFSSIMLIIIQHNWGSSQDFVYPNQSTNICRAHSFGRFSVRPCLPAYPPR